MANPFAPAAQSSSMDAMLPLMMMSMKPPAAAAPAQTPAMAPDTFKPAGGTGSFAGTPAPAPTQNQLGGKTLLGQ